MGNDRNVPSLDKIKTTCTYFVILSRKEQKILKIDRRIRISALPVVFCHRYSLY